MLIILNVATNIILEIIIKGKKLKKPQYGVIEISTFTKKGTVGLRFRDDGRGLQLGKLKQRALESGKWKAEEIEKWNDQQLADLIFNTQAMDKYSTGTPEELAQNIIKFEMMLSGSEVEMLAGQNDDSNKYVSTKRTAIAGNRCSNLNI